MRSSLRFALACAVPQDCGCKRGLILGLLSSASMRRLFSLRMLARSSSWFLLKAKTNKLRFAKLTLKGNGIERGYSMYPLSTTGPTRLQRLARLAPLLGFCLRRAKQSSPKIRVSLQQAPLSEATRRAKLTWRQKRSDERGSPLGLAPLLGFCLRRASLASWIFA
jgi:hypothetical protein